MLFRDWLKKNNKTLVQAKDELGITYSTLQRHVAGESYVNDEYEEKYRKYTNGQVLHEDHAAARRFFRGENLARKRTTRSPAEEGASA